ncbi:MAG: crossover junction endodeoxyribonuclease RuvC [Gammaproteobacteria bacterium]
MRILGIDPGYRITGYAVIDSDGQQSQHVCNGVIRATTDDPAQRLRGIFERVAELIAEFAPQEMAVEKVFVARNADSALKLGQARAAAICASFGAEIKIAEYAARLVKQSIVGKGNADKSQVQHMVKALLQLEGDLAADAADALAIALCHAHMRAFSARLDDARLAGGAR